MNICKNEFIKPEFPIAKDYGYEHFQGHFTYSYNQFNGEGRANRFVSET